MFLSTGIQSFSRSRSAAPTASGDGGTDTPKRSPPSSSSLKSAKNWSCPCLSWPNAAALPCAACCPLLAMRCDSICISVAVDWYTVNCEVSR